MALFSIAGLADLIKQVAGQGTAFLKGHRRLVQYVFSGAILAFLGLYVYRHARELATYQISLDLPDLALASILILSVNFLTPLAWGLILQTFLQSRLSWRESLRIWYVSQVSKYLPGSMWNYVSRVYLCGQKGISTSKAVLSMVLEIVLILLAQCIVFLVSLAFWPGGQGKTLWVLLLLPAGLIFLHPRIFNGLLAFFAHKRGLDAAPRVTLHAGNVGGLLALYTVGASVVGSAFFFFAHSLYPLPSKLLPALTGIMTLSLIVGFLAPFAPYGLGVREGLLTLLLSQYLPAPMAILISLASRLWLTANELLGLFISLALQRNIPDNPKGL
jgi:glycosyltransferase 2 family protein